MIEQERDFAHFMFLASLLLTLPFALRQTDKLYRAYLFLVDLAEKILKRGEYADLR